MRSIAHHQHQHPQRPVLSLAVAAALLGACDGCPSKPYTPYTMTDQPGPDGGGGAGGETAGGADAAAPDAGGAPAFDPILAAPAPGDGKVWAINPGVDVAAPAGRTFTLGLTLDADGDGKNDLLAWAQAPDGIRGELLFASGAEPGAPRTIVALPSDVSARGCSAKTSLAQVGPRSAALDIAPQCGAMAKPPAARWVAVARFGGAGATPPRPPELALEIRVGPLAPGEDISVSIDTRDRDADGRDDIAAKLTLTGSMRPFSGAVGPFPTVPPASASVAFLDRPAGLSRDPSEPEASLTSFVLEKGLLASAKKKDTADRVAAAVHQIRRFRSLVCEESGRAAVTTSAGPIRCGDPGSLADASLAEATAAFTLGDPARALAAIGRLDALPNLGDARKREILKLLGKGAPFAKVEIVHRASAVPAPAAALGYGPLTFDAGGDLLVRTESGVTRIDRTSFTETPAGLAAWPDKLLAGSFALERVEQRCDSPTLIAVFADASEGSSASRAESPLPLFAPVTARGLPGYGRCTPVASVPVAPVGWVPELGLVVGIGPDLVAIKKQPEATVVSLPKLPLPAPLDVGSVPAGAARSPDGATIAVPTSRGLLVAPAGGAAKLWTGQEIDQASACTPSPGGARVACVGGGAALIYKTR
jgi:hypothetical protein